MVLDYAILLNSKYFFKSSEAAMGTTSQRFDTFLSNLQLSEAQLTDAVTKHTGVRKALHNAFYGQPKKSALEEAIAEYAFKEAIIKSYKASEVTFSENIIYQTSMLVGSYGKNTEITPPSDIDILFIMPANLFSKYYEYAWNGQSLLLQDIRTVLKKTYPDTDIRADGQIVLVPFSSYKVEVLPVFLSSEDIYLYPDTNNGGSWKVTAPKAEKKNISESNKQSSGNTVRLIKMMKAWKRYCNVPIKSLGIELRAVQFLSNWQYYDKSSVYYDWMTRDFLAELIARANYSVQIPGISEQLAYGDAWKSKAETAYARAVRACNYESKNEHDLATEEWKKIFGAQFYY